MPCLARSPPHTVAPSPPHPQHTPSPPTTLLHVSRSLARVTHSFCLLGAEQHSHRLRRSRARGVSVTRHRPNACGNWTPRGAARASLERTEPPTTSLPRLCTARSTQRVFVTLCATVLVQGFLIVNEGYGMVRAEDSLLTVVADRPVSLKALRRYVNRVSGRIRRRLPQAILSASLKARICGTGVGASCHGREPPLHYYDDASLVAAGGDPLGYLSLHQIQFYPDHVRVTSMRPTHSFTYIARPSTTVPPVSITYHLGRHVGGHEWPPPTVEAATIQLLPTTWRRRTQRKHSAHAYCVLLPQCYLTASLPPL